MTSPNPFDTGDNFIDKKGNVIDNNAESMNHNPYKKASIRTVHNDIFWLGWGLTIIYIQTFIIFPGVFIQGGIKSITNVSWEIWFIITLFNVFDTLARFITERWMVLTTFTTVVAVSLRSIFITFAFFSAYDVAFFSSDTIKIINIAIVGFTNGYIGN